MASLNYFDRDKQEWVAIPLGGSGGDSAVTVHDGSIPNPAEETPRGMEDSLAAYADGLHYFKEPGSLLAITRQQYQTDITLTGPVSSAAKIVKSEAGLPTPQNPSMIVLKTADGQWIKMTSDELDKPFGQPQRVDLFDVATSLLDKDIRLGNVLVKSAIFQDSYKFYVDNVGFGVRPVIEYSNQGQVTRIIIPSQDDVYTKTEVDTSLSGAGLAITQIQDNVSNANGRIVALEAGKADKSDTYTKKEVDDAREADKDFSITNDNVLLASLTSLQEVVSNLDELGTAQIDVLDAIRDVEIQPSAIRLTGDAVSPIAWKGGLSLVPVKDGADWKLDWNNGKTISPIATTADLVGYAKTQDNTQQLLSQTVVAQGYGFGDSSEPPVAINYADSGEGYGDRLIVNIGAAREYLVYKSDLDQLFPQVDTSQFSTTVTVAALDTRIKSLESKAATTSNINDASNTALKKSILDAVALMIAGGGRQPPADIDWTACRINAGIQARMIAGVIELRGVLAYSTGASGDSSFAALPVSFPTPEITCFMPVASRVTTGSVAVAAFVRFTAASATIGFDAAAKVNELYLAGIKVKAAY